MPKVRIPKRFQFLLAKKAMTVHAVLSNDPFDPYLGPSTMHLTCRLIYSLCGDILLQR